MFKASIGQDSHAFDKEYTKPLILGGVRFDEELTLRANSDGDVVLHAITNAVSGITGVNILGKTADEMCRSGITDSAEYLKEALRHMPKGAVINHISISIEALRPKFADKIAEMKNSIASLLGIDESCVGITATTGEGLTAFGQGLGIQALVILSCDLP